MRRALLLLILVATRSGAAAQIPPKDNYVLTETDAFVLMPPEVVCGPTVKRAVWSGDGRYLLLERESVALTPALMRAIASGNAPQNPPAAESSIVVWSAESRKSTEVWKCAQGQGGLEAIHWLPDSPVAFLRVWTIRPSQRKGETESVEQLLRLNAAFAQTKVIAEGEGIGHALHVSPTRRFALIESIERSRRQVQAADGTIRTVNTFTPILTLLRENGTMGPPARLPQGSGVSVHWSASGAEPILRIPDREATRKLQDEMKDKRVAVWRWFRLDPTGGTSDLLPNRPELFEARTQDAPIRIKAGQAAAKEKETSALVPLLWLEAAGKSDKPRALVNANVQTAELSPDAGGILQISQGAALVTPVMKMPRALFVKMQEDAQRMVALSNGKQLGLGLLMYSQDYDNILPGPDGVNEKISPYIKDQGLLQGFVYTFSGGALSGINDPASTELGYVTGPLGRAVIYADGHVVWKPD